MSEEKIIEHLLKKKEKLLLNSEKNIETYKKNIENLKNNILSKQRELNNVREENEELNKKYFMLKELIIENGVIFSIINKSYNIKEWDNLYIKFKEQFLVITLKDGTEIKIIERLKGGALKKLLKEHKYSIVITRIESNLIKAKLYFNE